MFEYPYMLYLLILIPFAGFFFFLDIHFLNKRSKKVAGSNRDIIIPYYTEGQRWIRNIFYITALVFSVLALARPKWGMREITTDIKGRDLLFLVDVSHSMTVPDVYPNRLELVKNSLLNYISSGTTDRAGIMVFTSETEILVPFTRDYGALSYFINALTPGMVGNGGTDITGALSGAIDAFEDESLTDKVIILITDGEDLAGNDELFLKKVKPLNIRICTAGVGTTSGQPVPVRNDKGEIENYMRDAKGNPVVSRLDEKYLEYIASSTGGAYYKMSTSSSDFNYFLRSLGGVTKGDSEKKTMRQTKDQYVLFLIPAFLLFIAGLFLDLGKFYRRRSKWVLSDIFSRTIISVVFMTLSLPVFSSENLSSQFYKNGAFYGNKKYLKNEFNEALKEYSKSMDAFTGKELAGLYYNLANSFMMSNDFKNAEEYFAKAASTTDDKELLKEIYYNRGICSFKNKQFSQAADYFKESLKIDDSDDDTRYNYVISKLFTDNQDNSDDKNQDQNEQQKQEQNQSYSQILEALEQKEQNERENNEYQKNNPSKGVYW